ncbi:uncharacterized protein KY384_005595 [Bacidia gigantensis]|uniref:uncharacterized protein n=1 Tax=Bacidia gigantensis TaxID=2732470 RepID=UPI001D03CEC0|nr:uncharacterized protein KY384_005595 [Bacidia gigantensis]KAG8530113.1 hypothetical protein KY384_005595 [Bacidia gigantensis]
MSEEDFDPNRFQNMLLEGHHDILFTKNAQSQVMVFKRDDKYPGIALSDTTNHIRLAEIRILNDATIVLRFHAVPLAKAAAYTALSYTWGSMLGQSQSQGLQLTGNLADALYSFASWQPKLWWIDALCINQGDTREKNEQIKLMKQIYQKAERVCVWLGQSDEGVLQVLPRIARSFEEAKAQSGETESVGPAGLKIPGSDWTSLMDFLSRPFFRRIWVLQELLMAGDSIIVGCGSARFSWKFLALPIWWLRANNAQGSLRSQPYNLDHEYTLPIRNDIIDLVTNLSARPRSLSLEQLLRLTYALESSEPRDKIIALLGLASNKDPALSKINIGYEQSVRDIYCNVTGVICTTHRSISLLELVGDQSFREFSDLPSWVPDYSVTSSRPQFNNESPDCQDSNVEVAWIPGSRTLSLGVQVSDEVAHVSGDIMMREEKPEDALLSWFKMTAEFIEVDKWALITRDPEESGHTTVNAFWRAMIGDSSGKQCPAPKEYYDHFCSALFQRLTETGDRDEQLQWNLALCKSYLNKCHYSEPTEIEDKDIKMYHFICATIIENKRQPVKSPHWTFPEPWLQFDEDGKFLAVTPPGDAKLFKKEMARSCWNTRFFITRSGRMGRGPLSIQPSDKICRVAGAKELLVLREADEHLRFIGNCYTHGLVHDQDSQQSNTFKEVTLV